MCCKCSSFNGIEKYPRLRFPEFSDSYHESTLGEIFEYERPDNYIVSSEKYSDSFPIPVLTANQAFVLGYTNETTGIYDKGPVILFDDFTCDMKYADFPFKVKSSAMKLLTPQEGIPIFYAYNLLQHINYKPEGHARHWISIMQPIKVSLPCHIEQKRISEFLSLVCKRIEKHQMLIATLKKYKRGVVKTLLDPKQNQHQGVIWKTDAIGNLGTFIKGAALSKADISDFGTPFILYGELYTTYKEVVRSIVRTTQASVDDVHLSKVGDVVIPTSGETPEEISTASCIMVPNVILAGDLNIYRSTIVDGRIMSYLLNHIVNEQIARVAQGKSVVHVQASEVGKIPITYPDHNEQERIAQILELIDNRIAVSEKALISMQMMKKAFLQQLFI